MIFLIEYHRSAGMIVTLSKFRDDQRQEAERARLDLELSLLGKPIDYEVVLLEADSEEALRKTHRRYFEDLKSLTEAARP